MRNAAGDGHDLRTMTSGLWYRALLCDALVDACQVPIIREHFADALGAAGWPDGACLFLSTRQTRGKSAKLVLADRQSTATTAAMVT